MMMMTMIIMMMMMILNNVDDNDDDDDQYHIFVPDQGIIALTSCPTYSQGKLLHLYYHQFVVINDVRTFISKEQEHHVFLYLSINPCY